MKKTLFAIALLIFISYTFQTLPVNAQGLEISAPSAVLMETSSGEVLFEKNSNEIRMGASITKVMTLILTMEALESGAISLSDTMYASAHAASMGGSDIWLEEGEGMTVDDLIKATVIMSANDAAVVLAENIAGSEDAFVKMMNDKARELNMTNTSFKNPNGLEEEGHFTTAYDIALMSRELLKYEEILNYTLVWIDSVRGGKTQLVNTNKLIQNYEGITGLKTGTTSQAGSCITATAERDGTALVAVVLGCESSQARFDDATALLNFGFANWKVINPGLPELAPLAISGGMSDFVNVTSYEDTGVLTNINSQNEITSEAVFFDEIKAPIALGQEVGKILIKNGDEVLKEIPILATEDVKEISFSRAFIYLITKFANSFS